ncbi:MAG TPA: hypothetical protein VIM08_15120 [Arthrobacter sp.]|jgi:hypothetical protein
MSAAVIAYKATDNTTISRYMADRTAAHDAWWSTVRAFGEKIGHPRLSIRNGMFGSHVMGYAMEDGETPDDGWRVHKDWGVCVPNKRSKLGKDLEKELDGLSWRPPATLGVKDHLHAPSEQGGFSTYMLNPSIQQGNAGDWFLSFSRKPFDDDLAKIDPDVWQRASLADYYAQTEKP